ncbi:MAG: alpha/beta hydrolase, partial [Streptosporangiaceae bacterium]
AAAGAAGAGAAGPASAGPGAAGPIPVRVYRRADVAQPPVVIFLHGGGWILGSLDSADGTCQHFALESGCTVVSVGYRLAPEHVFPAALEDSLAVVRWVAAGGADAGGADRDGPPPAICVAGESSGGQLAASTCLAARDAGLGPIALQLLVCPVIDARMATASWRELGDRYLPCAEQMSWMWDLYAGAPEARHQPLVSVGEAHDLRGLPPALILTAEFDPLRDEAEQYGERLRGAGVAARLRRCDGQVHTVFGCAPAVDRCRQILDETAHDVARALGADPLEGRSG